MKRMRAGVLISGRGSNLKALIDACKVPSFPAEIVLVISNRPNAPGLQYAREAGIGTVIITHNAFPDRESFDKAMDQALEQAEVGLVCLAGFMRLLSPWFAQKWHNKAINIHPSLLPDFKGIDSHRQVIEAGAKVSGCTVHFVTVDMDAGPIILQAKVPVYEGDTEETLAARVLKEEHCIYPEALRLISSGKINVENGIVKVLP